MLEVDFNTPEYNGRYNADQLSNEKYHKIEGISASGIKSALQEPQIYLKKDKLLRLPSPAMDLGSCVHEGTLEKSKYNISHFDLKPADVKKANVMINNVDQIFGYILKSTENENSFIMKDEVLDTVRKVRVDAYDETNGIVYDVKTTRYGTAREFMNDAYKLGYPLQASFYLDTLTSMGYNAKRFIFLCIPSVSPCLPYAVEMTLEVIEDGRGMYAEIIYEILDMKNRKDHRVKFIPFIMPDWRYKQLNGEV